MSHDYEPIVDWSNEGRAALVKARGDKIRYLLDTAFTTFIDENHVPLSEFGFRGPDPVPVAVEWCMEAFQTRNLDPAKLHKGSRSFRLFTEVGFWLSQKVSRRVYNVRMASRTDSYDEELDLDPRRQRSPEDAVSDSQVRDAQRALGSGAQKLVTRTTAPLLTWWLIGSEAFRAECFGWESSSTAPEKLSAKHHSFAVADAMWRYLCLFLGLVPEELQTAATLSLFSPCAPEFRYEVNKKAVAESLNVGVREMERQRKQQIGSLIERCAEVAAREPRRDAAPMDSVRIVLAQTSLRDSLFHLYRLNTSGDTALRAHALPKGIR